MVQYTLWGMLLKPCSGPSTRYMIVPKSTDMISTKKTNTKIFVLLARRARIKLFDSPTNLTSFNILNILSSLKARNAVKYCDPTNNKDRYLGMVERKSIIPKKLKMYFDGLLMQTMRRIYSMENNMVTIHSEILKKRWYLTSYRGTLSSNTIMTL